MSRGSLVCVCALVALGAACDPEPRQTTPPSGGTAAPRGAASDSGGSNGLSSAQMTALRRLMGLRREAALLTRQRKFAEAIERLNSAMVIAPTIFGARHPFPAQIASQKAYVYEEASNWAMAAKAYDQVIALWRRALDVKEHEPVADALRKKGVALMRVGKVAQSITVLTRALAMWHRVAKLPSGRYGPFFLHVSQGAPTGSIASCTLDLGEAYLRNRQLKEAEAHLLRAEALLSKGTTPAQLLVQLHLNLAYVLQSYGRYKKSTQRLEKVVAILAKAGPNARELHLRFLLRLVDLHLLLRDFASAGQVLGRAQKVGAQRTRAVENHHLHLQIALAEVYVGTQRQKQGVALLKALGPKVARAKKSHWLRTRYHVARGRSWLQGGRHKQARQAAQEALAAVQKLKTIRPLHVLVHELAANTLGSPRGLVHAVVAYWLVAHLGAEGQPLARRLFMGYCRISKKVGIRRTKRSIIKARGEALKLKVSPIPLPPCP